jgi:hypothetical protein
MWNISTTSMITNGARCSREIKYSIFMVKGALNKKNTLFISKLCLNFLKRKLVKCYIWSITLHGAGTGHFVKHLGSYEMWCYRRMEKISWTDRVRTEEGLYRVKEVKNILHTVKRRKANWIG